MSLESLEPKNATSLTELAIEHGVAAILYGVLQQSHCKSPLFNSLADFQIHQNLRNQLLAQQFQHTLIQLTATGIKFVVLKGFALSHTVYPNPLLRTKADVDILIRIEDKNTVISAFESMGFSNPRGWNPTAIINQFSMRKTLSPGLNVDFDIHLRISNELGVENILTFDELMTSADMKTLKSIPLACKAHGLIHAIVHLLHHRNVGDTVKLIWLYDLLLLCQQMSTSDKAHFRKCVDEKGLGELAKFALKLANQHFEDESIDKVVEILEGVSTNPELEYLIRVDSRTNQFRRSLKQRKSFREKWLFIQEMAFPPAQEIYQKYGKQPSYLMPYFYVRRLIGGVIKLLFN
ncbi:nucleotidyltransferase family protein [Aliiglaciecola sp. 2_MG-2023]|uniref:nucleotidyltransferase family protein n=1 Tax=unclassified Aliiglaciecola TaxID=2593648 RepID=UPI0026E17A5B|nr:MULTISPECIES: nucleotidyltransferase family protein [unclassified Aliiglaciecola]MDO6712871.1 nucleotidyltransferase family protein [Aliiglaciecola sp. 2_MG-2023]MDO6752893.1 nucleotidyltransferase family protein [Aliiglaciecola sp. 1_MG-2023]